MAGQVAKVCKSFMRCGAIQQQMAAPCLSTVVHRRSCKMVNFVIFVMRLSLRSCYPVSDDVMRR